MATTDPRAVILENLRDIEAMIRRGHYNDAIDLIKNLQKYLE